MIRHFFGTDGVRGRYGGPFMNEDFVGRLARAAACFFREELAGDFKRVVVGRDTRASGEPLSAAIIAALVDTGLEVLDAGIAPTPAVAGAMEELDAQLGVVVTASHNPAGDNGVKFFAAGGRKLTDEDEAKIERFLDDGEFPSLPGGVMRRADVSDSYVKRMRTCLPADSLAGWRIVVDVANGATVDTTPAVLMSLGADLILRGHKPDGTNINDGVGTQHPSGMVEAVTASDARLGIAHDGDGDRVIFCDEAGDLLDGDDVMAILALRALQAGTLRKNTLVATVQSNLGLDKAVERAGGKVVRTEVGDRYVVDEMRRHGYNVGGESSGHLVLSDMSPTGDGLAGALRLIEVMQATGEPLSSLRRCWQRFPQATVSLKVGRKTPLHELTLLPAAIARAEAELGSSGRVLVRYSGTEPKLRLLVEGENADLVHSLLEPLRTAAVAELVEPR